METQVQTDIPELIPDNEINEVIEHNTEDVSYYIQILPFLSIICQPALSAPHIESQSRAITVSPVSISYRNPV